MIYVPVAILAQLVACSPTLTDLAAMAAVMLAGPESKKVRQQYGLRDDQWVWRCLEGLYLEMKRGSATTF